MRAPKWFDVYRQGLVDGPIDVDYFCDQPNAATAKDALDFLDNQANELAVREHHSQADLERMWRATFRSCIAHDVPIPSTLQGFAMRMGVVKP